MTIEREDMELAALAAGIDHNQWFNDCDNCESKSQWNPRTDPGDSLRLAAALWLHIVVFKPSIEEGIFTPGMIEIWEEGKEDPYPSVYFGKPDERLAATMEAIYLAAVAIGRNMQEGK